jgi:hypothetical protein
MDIRFQVNRSGAVAAVLAGCFLAVSGAAIGANLRPCTTHGLARWLFQNVGGRDVEHLESGGIRCCDLAVVIEN